MQQFNIDSDKPVVADKADRVLAKHHGWQWLLGQVRGSNKTNTSRIVQFDDLTVEKEVPNEEVCDLHRQHMHRQYMQLST